MSSEVILDSIDAGGSPFYVFIDRDEDTLLLRLADDPKQSIVIEKTALGTFSKVFANLSEQFPCRH